MEKENPRDEAEEGAMRSWLTSRFAILDNRLSSAHNLLRSIQTTMENQERSSAQESFSTKATCARLKKDVVALVVGEDQIQRNYAALVHTNNCLKLENEDLKIKLVAALLLGKLDESAVVHFLEKNERAPELTEGIIETQSKLSAISNKDAPPITTTIDSPLVLRNKVKALEEFIQSLQAKHALEVFHLNSRATKAEDERSRLRSYFAEKTKDLSTKLTETQRLLAKTVEENVELQGTMIEGEKKWMEEEERLLTLLHENCPSFSAEPLLPLPGGPRKGSIKATITSERKLKEQLARTEIDLLVATTTVKEYEVKLIRMQDKLEQLRTKLTLTEGRYSNEVEKLRRNNEMLQSRSARDESHRKLQAEGFRTELKDLKEKLNALRVNFERFEMGLVQPHQFTDEVDADRYDMFSMFVGASVEAAARLKTVETMLVSRKTLSSSSSSGTSGGSAQ